MEPFANVLSALGGSRSLSVVAIAALLAGCADMQGIEPTAHMTSAAALQSATALARARLAEADWPQTDWWRRFGDPQLDRLEAEALASSPSLVIARARLDKARALAGIAGAARWPQLDASVSSTRQRYSEHGIVPPPLAGSWQTDSRAALEFGYEFDFWGKNRAALDAALGQAEATRVDAFGARLLLTVGVARAYVQLARIDDQLDIARSALQQREQITELTRRRVAAGIDTRVELKQAEAALPATRENIAALREAEALVRHQLAALLGQGPDRALAIERPQLLHASAKAALPTRLPADLIGRRPDVIASRWRVEVAAKDIDVAKAQFYPDIDLIAFVGVQSLGLSNFLHAGSGIAGVGPALRLPIFEGGRLRSSLRASDADYDAAVATYNATLVDALRDIGDRLAAARSVATQSDEQRIALADTREAYELAVLRYREGTGNYLSVLVAQAQVLAQQRLGADLHARAFDNQIDLIRALGGGFDDAAPAQPAA